MKKTLLILKQIAINIKVWLLEELAFYVKFYKRKNRNRKLERAKAVCKHLAKGYGRAFFIVEDKELGILLKKLWPESFTEQVISPFVILCNRNVRFLQTAKLTEIKTGKRVKILRKLSSFEFDKLKIYIVNP